MTYMGYVIGAYAVFALVMLWDLLAPHWRIRHELRAARRRKARGTKSAAMELSR